MTGRMKPYRLPDDPDRGPGWRDRLRAALQDGLALDGDDAVLAEWAQLVTKLRIVGKRGPKTSKGLLNAARADFLAPDIKQTSLAADADVTDSAVSQWIRHPRFLDEWARHYFELQDQIEAERDNAEFDMAKEVNARLLAEVLGWLTARWQGPVQVWVDKDIYASYGSPEAYAAYLIAIGEYPVELQNSLWEQARRKQKATEDKDDRAGTKVK